jgi:hypothetical protein
VAREFWRKRFFLKRGHSKLDDCVGLVQKTVERFGKVDI